MAFHAIGRKDPVEYIKPWDDVLADALVVEQEHKDAEYKEQLTELQYYVHAEQEQNVRLPGNIGMRKGRAITVACCSTLLFTFKHEV